ncbi:voltage-dependent anion-selective channel isoform X1 [Drosophila takahashii]|uniref:voltage-dependent anion-selective channel isoform X1 n=1 Tax=Drosophila takahashii TaxID=29030 RepID=UPI001CF86DC6|nr:voltage-dependent anion-selective channel [Drosophila takahashii]
MPMRNRIRNLFRRNKRKRLASEHVESEATDNSGGDAQNSSNEDEAKKENRVEILPPPPMEGEMPTYFHVGLLAKMCLIHGYSNGLWKLQSTSKTEKDFFLSSFGEGYPTWNSVYGGLEAYKEEGNFHVSLAWLTDGYLLSDLGARGDVLGGMWSSVVKSMLGTSEGCEYQCKVKCAFERNPAKVELYVPIYKDPLFMGYILAEPAKNYLLGYRTVFNVEDKKFSMHALCMGYSSGSTEVGLKLENFETIRGSIFQRIGEKWALALKANLYGNVNAKSVHIGGQYELEPGTSIKAKVRGDTRLGFVFQRKLREDIEVLLHFCFEGKYPINGKHKFGASWYFNM